MRPAPFMVYKGSAALRLQLLPAAPKEEGSDFAAEGCIMLEMANAKEGKSRTYDWENKIIFKLSSKDVGDILAFLKKGAKGDVSLIHDPSKVSGADTNLPVKILAINEHEGKWFWKLTFGEEKRSIPIDMSELVRMQQLLNMGVVKIYGW